MQDSDCAEIPLSARRAAVLVNLNMLFAIEAIFVLSSQIIMVAGASDKCPGYRQDVNIPESYIKYVPDAHYTGNVTQVHFLFRDKNIQIKEERQVEILASSHELSMNEYFFTDLKSS